MPTDPTGKQQRHASTQHAVLPRGQVQQPARGEKHPAVRVLQIAAGEIEEDTPPDDGRNAAAVALGRMGGNARAARVNAVDRAVIARKAGEARWKDQIDKANDLSSR
jgi:hypothetical protein